MRTARWILMTVAILSAGVFGFLLGRDHPRKAAIATLRNSSQPSWHSPNKLVSHKRVSTAPLGLKDLSRILATRPFERLKLELQKAGYEMALANLSEAVAAFHSLSNAHHKTAFLEGLLEVHARNSPAKCIEFVKSLPLGICKNSGVEKALAVIAETDPKAALAEIPTLVRGPDAHNTYLRIADTWTQLDPDAAFNW